MSAVLSEVDGEALVEIVVGFGPVAVGESVVGVGPVVVGESEDDPVEDVVAVVLDELDALSPSGFDVGPQASSSVRAATAPGRVLTAIMTRH